MAKRTPKGRNWRLHRRWFVPFSFWLPRCLVFFGARFPSRRSAVWGFSFWRPPRSGCSSSPSGPFGACWPWSCSSSSSWALWVQDSRVLPLSRRSRCCGVSFFGGMFDLVVYYLYKPEKYIIMFAPDVNEKTFRLLLFFLVLISSFLVSCLKSPSFDVFKHFRRPKALLTLAGCIIQTGWSVKQYE